jgi:predicted signal transduction protein with EAL and GGDEF domain
LSPLSAELSENLADVLHEFRRQIAIIEADTVVEGLADGIALIVVATADLAMYRARAERPGTERFFSPEMKEEVQQEIDLESELRRAFANAEFELHYQPQVDL